jgi:hypothetical protein
MRGSKDAALAFAIRGMLNARFGALGEISDVSLDTRHRCAQLRLVLLGESKPIDVDVREYDVDHVGEENWLTIGNAVASRQWLSAALHQFAVGRRFHISSRAAAALRLLT